MLGWVLGRLTAGPHLLLAQGLKGLFLGLFVALALAIVDALWNLSLRQWQGIAARAVTSLLVGSLGGFVGGVFSQKLYDLTHFALFQVLGWTFTGLLIGAAPGVFDLVTSQLSGQDQRGPLKKVINGILGGTVGGLIGGFLSLVLHGLWSGLFESKPVDQLWSPSALGFVILGACIGLLIGLAQVFLKEAWLRVEEGFRAGRELILSKPLVTMGRAESCDIGLFGDNQVERLHAQLQREGDGYVLTDAGSATGTYLNDERLTGPRRLAAGDVIRVGRSVLRFGERRREAASQ